MLLLTTLPGRLLSSAVCSCIAFQASRPLDTHLVVHSSQRLVCTSDTAAPVQVTLPVHYDLSMFGTELLAVCGFTGQAEAGGQWTTNVQ